MTCEIKSHLSLQLENRVAAINCLSEEICALTADDLAPAQLRMFALEVESETRVQEWESIQRQLHEHRKNHGC